METTSSNIFLNQKTENPSKEIPKYKKEYKLIKNNLSYIIDIKLSQKTSNNNIKIKASKINNKCFYLYTKLIDLEFLKQIFNECDNLEKGYNKIIDLFENKKVAIKEIIIDKLIILNFIINGIDNIEMKLLKTDIKEKKIIKELINNYNF